MDRLADIRDLPLQHVWGGIAARVLHGDELTLGLVELEPGADLPEHSHANEQLGMVIEGSITFTIAGETRRLGQGGTWCIPGGTPHSAQVGPEGAVVVDVFAPPREDWKSLPAADGQARWPA